LERYGNNYGIKKFCSESSCRRGALERCSTWIGACLTQKYKTWKVLPGTNNTGAPDNIKHFQPGIICVGKLRSLRMMISPERGSTWVSSGVTYQYYKITWKRLSGSDTLGACTIKLFTAVIVAIL
jgi:hypothetical protein